MQRFDRDQIGIVSVGGRWTPWPVQRFRELPLLPLLLEYVRLRRLNRGPSPLLRLLWSLSANYQHISSVSEAQLYNAPFMALWKEMAVGRRNGSRPSPSVSGLAAARFSGAQPRCEIGPASAPAMRLPPLPLPLCPPPLTPLVSSPRCKASPGHL